MSYEPPLRCDRCSRIIRKKPKAKTPKFCAPCREIEQEVFKEQVKRNRKRR